MDLSCYNGAPEIVTGSKDGKVKIWDLRQKNSPVITICTTNSNLSRECWCVAFGNSFDTMKRVVTAGYDNGDIKVLDLRNSNVIWEENLKNGICSLEFNRKSTPMNKLVATTLEGGLYTFNVKSFSCGQSSDVKKETINKMIHLSNTDLKTKSTVWLAKHIPQQSNNFVTASGEGRLQLWQYDYTNDQKSAPVVKLCSSSIVSSQPIVCLDWSYCFEGLAVCGSIDQSIRILLVTNRNFD